MDGSSAVKCVKISLHKGYILCDCLLSLDRLARIYSNAISFNFYRHLLTFSIGSFDHFLIIHNGLDKLRDDKHDNHMVEKINRLQN